jgi:hypothetical protein
MRVLSPKCEIHGMDHVWVQPLSSHLRVGCDDELMPARLFIDHPDWINGQIRSRSYPKEPNQRLTEFESPT